MFGQLGNTNTFILTGFPLCMFLRVFTRPWKSKVNGFLLGMGTADISLGIPEKPRGRQVSLLRKGSSRPWGHGLVPLSQNVNLVHPKGYISDAGAVL